LKARLKSTGLIRLATGLLSFLIVVPTVLAQGTMLHLFVIILGTVSALYFKNKTFALLTVLSFATYYFSSLTVLVMWYPVLVSLGLASIFIFSLFNSQTIIEKFALLERASLNYVISDKVKELDTKEKNYCRALTKIWIIFFTLNAVVAIWTIEIATKETWAFYNGVLSYVIAAALFVAERILRKYIVGKTSI
jgi:uncharacterized membrane protein